MPMWRGWNSAAFSSAARGRAAGICMGDRSRGLWKKELLALDIRGFQVRSTLKPLAEKREQLWFLK
jgi:hypothetical protein